MSRKFRSLGLLLLAGSMALAACGGKAANATPTPDADAVYTAAAATVGAQLTQAALLTPSPTNTPPPTETPQPTATQPTPEASPTTVTLAPTKVVVPDQAAFVSETIPDGTKVAPGQSLTKTWTLKNVGTSTWTTAYQLVFYSGEHMAGPNGLNLTKTVKPNETIEITLGLTAPTTAGKYQGNWVLRNADGVNFFPVSIVIEVGSATLTPTEAPTAEPPTATPTP